MKSSNTTLTVTSRRLNKIFTINKFLEYNIDIDLETDADIFSFIISNVGGIYTGIINRFDKVSISINGIGIISGEVDRVIYQYGSDNNTIQVNGRDMAHILIDNDALPSTLYSINPSKYIISKCSEYGIKCNINSNTTTINKLIIGTSESEISIMNNLLINDRHRLWYIYDTLYSGKWSTSDAHSYTFTRGVNYGTHIKSLSLTEDGTDTKSEIKIYGSTNNGANKIVGTARNDWMINNNIRRRSTRRSSNDDSVTKYSANALEDIRDGFKDNIQLVVSVPIKDTIILPNKTALVVDTITKLNAIFFIVGVTYHKNTTNGGIIDITMIPGDTTFNVLWNGQGTETNGGITGTPKMTISDVIASRKG